MSGTYSRQEYEAMQARFDHRCAECRTDQDIVTDHIVPMFKGGTNTADNLQLLCKKHHDEKSRKERWAV